MRLIKYPKKEIVWVSYYNECGDLCYVMTSSPLRDMYFLYEIKSDGSLARLGKSATPSYLEEKYSIINLLKKK